MHRVIETVRRLYLYVTLVFRLQLINKVYNTEAIIRYQYTCRHSDRDSIILPWCCRRRSEPCCDPSGRLSVISAESVGKNWRYRNIHVSIMFTIHKINEINVQDLKFVHLVKVW